MTVCRRDRRRTALLAVVLAAAMFGAPYRAGAADSPVGRIISAVVPVNNRVHPSEQIVGVMHSRPGKVYDEGVIQEDVRRLHGTKWFTPGGVQVHTRIDPDGKVTVFVYLTELTATVQDVLYLGAQ